jgi:hypothetical protein
MGVRLALQQAIFAALTNDARCCSAAGAPRIWDDVPARAGFP